MVIHESSPTLMFREYFRLVPLTEVSSRVAVFVIDSNSIWALLKGWVLSRGCFVLGGIFWTEQYVLLCVLLYALHKCCHLPEICSVSGLYALFMVAPLCLNHGTIEAVFERTRKTRCAADLRPDVLSLFQWRWRRNPLSSMGTYPLWVQVYSERANHNLE